MEWTTTMSIERGLDFTRNQRTASRRLVAGELEYQCGAGDTGVARWVNVSPRGGAVVLGRYLRPGTFLLITPADGEPGDRYELKAQIVWCLKESDSENFAAGLRIFQDESEAANAIKKLVGAGHGWTPPAKGVHWLAGVPPVARFAG